MSIDAKIVGTSRHANGEVTISLEPSGKGATVGQSLMTVLNPPPLNCDLARLIGLQVWGGSSCLMVGESKLADRVGYTQIKLVEGWVPIASKALIDRLLD